MLLYRPQYSKCLYSLSFLMAYISQTTAAINLTHGGQSLCPTLSTITYDPTATFTLGPGEGCFVLQPRPMVRSDITTSSTAPSTLRRCPAFALDAPRVDKDPCHEHNTNQSRSLVDTATSMLGDVSLPAITTSVSSYVPAVPAVTELNVPLLDGKAEYISTLMDGSSSTSTSTPAPKTEFSAPLTSSLFSFTQDADRIDSSATSPAIVPLSAPGFTAAAISPMLTTPSTPALVPLSAPGYTAATLSIINPSASLFKEGSTAVTTIGHLITQTVQEQVVSKSGTVDLQTSPSERLDPEAPISVPGVAASTDLGQLIAQPFQTTPISIATETEAPVSNGKALPMQAPLPTIMTSLPFTDIAGLHGQPETSPNPFVVPTPSPPITQAAPLIQTISNSVISSTISLQTETIGSAATTDDLGSLQSNGFHEMGLTAPLVKPDFVTFSSKSVTSSPIPVTQCSEDAPLSAGDHTGNTASSRIPVPVPLPPVKAPLFATGVAVAVTPGQSITYFPTVCLAPLYSPTISIITQYQTVTVTATPNSTSSSTFSPDTTFHLSIVTIAPTGASTTTAAASSKSEVDDDWTGCRSASVVFVGLVVSLYGMVG